MFAKYMICEDGFRNVREGEEVTGFQFQARLPYYRGLGLSMVEDLIITLDGEPIPRESILFTVRENTYTLAEMETESVDRWEFGEVATLTVKKPDGLAPGSHTLDLVERLRISYLPFPSLTRDTKVLALA